MSKKILIVEDEKILRDMYTQKFSRSGFKVIEAEGAKDGLELAKKEKPDLILLDILLPSENGVSFLEKLRKTPEISKIEVIAFSNYDDPRTRKEVKELGIKRYLIKTDYTPREIVEKIREFLNEKS